MRLRVLLLVFALILLNQVTAVIRPGYEKCEPRYTKNVNECKLVIATCTPQGIILKWTGPGTNGARRRPLGDGGCQCDQYCGYFSKKPCASDPQCFWNQNKRKCFNRRTGLPGFPIKQCPVQRSPTASPFQKYPARKPTSSPTTSMPTYSPTTSSPTKSPSVMCNKTGWAKVTLKNYATCFIGNGFGDWGWTNGKFYTGTTFYFTIYAGADQCNTNNGFFAGTGKIVLDKYRRPTIYYEPANSDIEFGTIKAYIGKDEFYTSMGHETVDPNLLPINVGPSPYPVNEPVPKYFYFYIHFDVRYKCKRSPTTSPTTSTPTASPSKRPTTSKPTYSPTTSKPTYSPTTSSPTKSPSVKCNETGWAKVNLKNYATCFIGNGFENWGWTNGKFSIGTTFYFTIYAGAGQCNTNNGFLAGTGKIVLDKYRRATIYYEPANSDIEFGTIKGYIGKDEFYVSMGHETVAPGLLPINVGPSPYLVTEVFPVPKYFYFYIHFDVRYKCNRSPTTSPTTSTPTASPSKSPTTSMPTYSPSKSPTTSMPTYSPSKSPTTSMPTYSPSKSPTTSMPTYSPSKSPTTSMPTYSPSKSPTTSMPTYSPTKRRCNETGWAKVKYPDYKATCFIGNGFGNWGWTNGKFSSGSTVEFNIYAAAGQCNTNNGFFAGDGKIKFDGNPRYADIYFQPPNPNPNNISFGVIKGYIGKDQFYTNPNNGMQTVAPGQLPITVVPPSPYRVKPFETAQPLTYDFYFYIHFEVYYDCPAKG